MAARGVKSKCHPSKSQRHFEPSDEALVKTVRMVNREANELMRKNRNLTYEEAQKLAVEKLSERYSSGYPPVYIGPEERRYQQLEAGRDTRPLDEEPGEMDEYQGYWEDQVRARTEKILKEHPDMNYFEAKHQAEDELQEFPPKSDFLWYNDEDISEMKKFATKERSFTSTGHDLAKAAKMSQQEAFKILSEWGDVMNPADYDLPDAYSAIAPAPYKSARDPKKWYTHAKHTGWRKTQEPSTRRAKLLAASPKNYTRAHRYRLAGRRAQALANVTQDKQTAVVANQDAAYFFDKLAELRT